MRPNVHWQEFAEEKGWWITGRSIEVDELGAPGTWKPSRQVEALFPSLATLLSRAHVSRVDVDGEALSLFSWSADRPGVRAWLCRAAVELVEPPVFSAHRALLEVFGGIVERSNEPEDSWLLSHGASLTLDEASHDASFLQRYAWAFEEVGGIPIEPTRYYCISREANGNTAICDRENGEVLLFAADHAFDFVEPLAGCPEYTLYRYRGAPTFAGWLDAIATQQLSTIL